MNFIRTEELPDTAKVSDDMKHRAKFFMEVMLFGITYYIPVTKETKNFFGIRVRNSWPVLPETDRKAYRFLQDLIGSVLLQVRDTVASDVKRELSSEIKEQFAKIFSGGLENAVDFRMNKHLEDKRDRDH
jgi:hypothetical protein